MKPELSNFKKRLDAMTNKDAAVRFGVTTRTVYDWKHGIGLMTVNALIRDPETVRALVADAEAALETKEEAAA